MSKHELADLRGHPAGREVVVRLGRHALIGGHCPGRERDDEEREGQQENAAGPQRAERQIRQSHRTNLHETGMRGGTGAVSVGTGTLPHCASRDEGRGDCSPAG